MADRPIPFSAPMVRALLAGTKTQTRRTLSRARVFATPETTAFTLRGDDLARALQNASRFRRLDGNGWFWESDAFEWQAPALRTGWMAHIGYAPGDQLWVREPWFTWADDDEMSPKDILDVFSDPETSQPGEKPTILWYADRSITGAPVTDEFSPGRLRRGMHLPRAFSRLTLIVTDVRVQRLQDISNEDCIAEGIPVHPNANAPRTGPAIDTFACEHGLISHYGAKYRDLWNAINGSGAWDANPWVVAYTFTVHQQNIDAIPASPTNEVRHGA